MRPAMRLTWRASVPGAKFAQQFGQERLPAHSDTALDLPCGNHDSGRTQCFRLGIEVLIVAVDERAVEIEQTCGKFKGGV